MTDVSSEDWDQKAWDVFMEPGDRVPAATDFGFCAYDDAPAALGGGFPWFYWFETKSLMLAALHDHAPYLYKPRGELDSAAIEAIARAQIASAEGDLEALRTGLNDHLVGLAHFTWIGDFDDLCKSERTQAKLFRGQFREDGDEAPIDSLEVADFAEFTASYGV